MTLPEMVVIDQHIPSGYAIRGYTSKEMYAYGQQCREAALEEAAQILSTHEASSVPVMHHYASAIRRLK